MSEDRRRGSGDPAAGVGRRPGSGREEEGTVPGPGLLHRVVELMEDFHHKLKLLQYEATYMRQLGHRAINR